MTRHFILFSLLFPLLSAVEPIAPLPTEPEGVDIAKARVGRMLFLDPILSSDQKISCHSCHSLDHGGADPRDVSVGAYERKGEIQSPSIYNARYNFRQFWNGRASDLKEQLSGPLHNPAEMDMTSELIERRLNNSTFYREQFKEAYGIAYITAGDVMDALVEFEKALVTPNSRFDRFLRGEKVLSAEERKGYATFKSLGCITCHNGINIGANTFQKMGLFREYPYNEKYQDRSALTKNALHKNVFKVPTLRNITQSAPYFHDASAKTLEEAVTTMARYNLGISIAPEERDLIIAFLQTLEGERPAILDLQ